MGERRDSMRAGSGWETQEDDSFFDVPAWRDEMLSRSPILERGAMPTIWSDPINRLQSIFAQDLATQVTLAAPTVIDTHTVDLESGHGFVVDDQQLVLTDINPEDPQLYLGKVINVVGDTITVDSPINHAYQIGSFGARTEIEMAVDGLTSRRAFLIQPPIGFQWDVTRILVNMICDGAPDDGKFGNIPSLTNGVVVRLCRNYGTEYYNLANWKSNSDIANWCYDVNYTERTVPQGSYGVRARWTLSGPEKMGAALRLRGGSGTPQQGPQDRLEFLIQDDLSALTSFKILVQGHWVDVVWNGQ